MADTFTTYLEITKPEVTGSADTWGEKLNDGLDKLDQIVAGTHTVSTTGGSTTLTDSQAENAHIGVIGTLASDATIVLPAVARAYVVRRATTGAYKVTFKTSGQTGGVVVAPATTAFLYCDGSNITTVSPSDAEFTRYSDAYRARGSVSGSVAISLLDGLTQSLTIAANTTLSITDVPTGTRAVGLTLFITNGGAYTITWPSGTKWADGAPPNFSAAGLDVVSLVSLNNGTNWHGILGGMAFA